MSVFKIPIYFKKSKRISTNNQSQNILHYYKNIYVGRYLINFFHHFVFEFIIDLITIVV